MYSINDHDYKELTNDISSDISNNNCFSNCHNTNDYCNYFMTLKYKYQLLNELINDLIGNNFRAREKMDIINAYSKHNILNNLSNISTIIHEKTIRYLVICYATMNYYDNDVKYTEVFIKHVSDYIGLDKSLNIILQYSNKSKIHELLFELLSKCKLNDHHLDLLKKHYKGKIDVLNYFMRWSMHPSTDYLSEFITNNVIEYTQINKDAYDDFNYILFHIKMNRYDKVKKINLGTLNDKQKKLLNYCIFSNEYPKFTIISMKKKFELNYDIDCLKLECKHNGRVAIYNYLTELGIKPDMECLCEIIPFHTSSIRVNDILNKCK